MGGIFFFFLAPLVLEQTCSHDLERFLLVLLLAAPVLATNNSACRNVKNLNRGVGGVHALAARTARTANFDPQIFRLQFKVDFLGLGKDSDGRGRSVNASLRFGRGDTLNPVDPTLEPQLLENVFARDPKDRFLEPAKLRRTGLEILPLEPRRFRVAIVHPVKVGGENGGLAPTGPGADLDDRV